MPSTLRLFLVSALAVSLLPGCGLLPKFKRKPDPPKQESKAPLQIGTITLVNTESSFVLIDSGYRMSPSVGGTLESRAPDGSVAVLRVTDIRKRPFVIADVVSGIPGKGDLVFPQKKSEKAAPGPVPGPSNQ